jgi:hypothetical protein
MSSDVEKIFSKVKRKVGNENVKHEEEKGKITIKCKIRDNKVKKSALLVNIVVSP